MKYRRAIYFQTEVLDLRANLCLKKKYPAIIKNDNGAIAMRKFCVLCKQKQQLHQFKKNDIGDKQTF